MLAQLQPKTWVAQQSIAVDHLGTDEPSAEVRVNLAGSLHRSLTLSNSPGPYLVGPNRIEMVDLQLLIR